MTYFTNSKRLVEDKIKYISPQTFAVEFDGWLAEATHYVAVFATFPSNTLVGYNKLKLGMASMGKDIAKTAEEHPEVWTLFGRCMTRTTHTFLYSSVIMLIQMASLLEK